MNTSGGYVNWDKKSSLDGGEVWFAGTTEQSISGANIISFMVSSPDFMFEEWGTPS